MTLEDGGASQLPTRAESALRELMVRAVALSDRPEEADELVGLVDRAPLDALADAAWFHGLSGTLERSLQPVPGFPPEVAAELRSDAEQDAIGALAHLAALLAIGRRFDRGDISWLTMKGPVVAHTLHTRPCDRAYADLDLLVDRRDFQAAVEALEAMGYDHQIEDWWLAEEMLAGQIELTNGLARVDLHWHLHYSKFDRSRTSLRPDEMLARTRRVELPGVSAPTFDEVDTLLNLAYHAARSDGHRLIWLKDIERSLVVDQPDLDELVRRCVRSECGPQVGVMLVRARDLLEVAVPDEVIRALVPAPILALDRAARRWSDPVQFHDRMTPMRFATRSVGRSTLATVAELPRRALHQARHAVVARKLYQASDPLEKQRFFDAVAGSAR